MRGLEFTTLHLPFGAGENTKPDERALAAPELASAIDVQFDEHKGLQTRRPYVAPAGAGDILGGGTINDARRIEANGDELVLFTRNAIYTRLESQAKWAFRGTHLAVAIDEEPVFTSTGDQRDCDRAELAGVILFAWVDSDGLWVAAQDAVTRATLMSPMVANAVGTRPRFVVLDTKVLLFAVDTAANDLEVVSLDPASPATAIAGGFTTVLAGSGSYYDVVRIVGADEAIGAVRRAVTTSYTAFKVTSGVGLTTNTYVRTCDGPIAVSCDPTGATVQVVRANDIHIEGDRLTVSSLATAASGQAIGTTNGIPVSQIAAAHRSVMNGGAYRCYAFWTAVESADNTPFLFKGNYVDTAGTIGTQAVLAGRIGVASRAFDYDGTVYVWGVFASESLAAGMGQPLGVRAQLQNTYILHSDDGTVVSKAVWQRSGGFSASTGYLPQVQLVSGTTGYAWCGTERRIIPLGPTAHTGYADRGPVDVLFTFDDNRARRCVRLGLTLYVSGGIVLQFDREGTTEVGFLYYPWFFGTSVSGAGAIPDGKYSYKSTYRWQNAQGETERSTTATGEQITISGGPSKVDVNYALLNTTMKRGSRRPVSVEIWRTEVNPTDDSPFFLATGNDPSVTTGDNPYIKNNPLGGIGAISDNLTDDDLGEREANPENGAVLEAMAPPPAQIIAAYGDRLWLGGIGGAPRQLWYSRLRGSSEVASFHDQNVLELPPHGGDLIALTFMDGIAVALCERAVFMIPGEGFDNNGQGSNYGPVRCVAYDVGCRDADSVATTPDGIVFQSSKGKQILTRGWTIKPLGLEVATRDAEPVLAAHVDERRHLIKWLTGSRMLVFDYLANGSDGAWAEWSVVGAVHATVWKGVHYYITASGPLAEQPDYSGTSYGLDVETAWLTPAGLAGSQGRCHLRALALLGELVEHHYLRVRLSYNYEPAVVDDRVLDTVAAASPYVNPDQSPYPGGPLQFRIQPSRPHDLESVKLRITAHGTPTQAVLDVVPLGLGDLSGPVDLDNPSSQWAAQLTASALMPGEIGNVVGIIIGFKTATIPSIDVRPHLYYDAATDRWSELRNCIGVRVAGNNTSARVEIADVEAAITASGLLATVTTPHAVPNARIDFVAMQDTTVSAINDGGVGGFHDGAFAAPTTACLKLTGLDLEVGVKRNLYPRLPAVHKV